MAWLAGLPLQKPSVKPCRCVDPASATGRQYFERPARLVQRKVQFRLAARQQALIQCVAEVAKPKVSFATVQSQEQFFGILEAGVAAKKIPQPLLLAFKDFYLNYKSRKKHVFLLFCFTFSPIDCKSARGDPQGQRSVCWPMHCKPEQRMF